MQLTEEQQKRITEADAAKAVRLAEAESARNLKLATAPRLSAETVIEYLDWVTRNLEAMPAEHIAHRLNAAELVVRIHMGNVQGKATQHTLVEDGTIAPPPPLGGGLSAAEHTRFEAMDLPV